MAFQINRTIGWPPTFSPNTPLISLLVTQLFLSFPTLFLALKQPLRFWLSEAEASQVEKNMPKAEGCSKGVFRVLRTPKGLRQERLQGMWMGKIAVAVAVAFQKNSSVGPPYLRTPKSYPFGFDPARYLAPLGCLAAHGC